MNHRTLVYVALGAGAVALAGCNPDETDTSDTSDTEDTSDTDTDTQEPAPTIEDWLLDVGMFSYEHATYGKPTYCGWYEMGDDDDDGVTNAEDQDALYGDVRCTDTTSYSFSVNDDGDLQLEEANYVHAITEPDPDGTWPWFVEHGFSGSIVWKLTPVDPALAAVDALEAREYEAEIVDWAGNDEFFSSLVGEQRTIVFARGTADDVMIDWTTSYYDGDTEAWVELGDEIPWDAAAGNPAWSIDVFPENGAFYEVACDAADRIEGASKDSTGADIVTGPGYCAPGCRMVTEYDPTGANGLPACEAAFLDEAPRAEALIPAE